MILMRGLFVGPLQAVSLGNSVVTQVKSAGCLGVENDSDLNFQMQNTFDFKSVTKSLFDELEKIHLRANQR